MQIFILFGLLVFFSIGSLLLGMLSPRLVLPFFKTKTRKKVFQVYFSLFAISLVSTYSTMPSEKEMAKQDRENAISDATSEKNALSTLSKLSEKQIKKFKTGEFIPELSETDPEIKKMKIETMKKMIPKALEEKKQDRLYEKRKANRDKRIKRFGEPPERNSFSGSYRVVEKHLKKVAHDPDSIETSNCSDVFYNEKDGWIIKCDYRGKNKLGALVKNSAWFVIRNGIVIQQKGSTAYK